MENLTMKQTHELQEIFDKRVNVELDERKLYAYDVGTMPKMMQRFAGVQVPAGIVQPINEAELVKLAVWAQKNSMPLVPRGKATSGYGGAVPARGGLVVETNRMKEIIEIDAPKRIVTVQAGIVWNKLESALNEKGLTLNAYPTSAPASTVAGWIATGGAGIGSYSAGYFRDSVVAIRMVLPDGQVKVLSGKELDLVENASGVTGFITQITFKVSTFMPKEKMAISFKNNKDIAAFIKESYRQKLKLWSISFINPEIANYSNQLPVRAGHGGHAPHARQVLPETYIVMAVFEKSADLRKKLEKLVSKQGGQVLSAEIADHEWEERFHPMKAKRISPSLIPAEVVVPVDALEQVLDQLKKKIELPFLLEGFGVKNDEIVLLGFIPHDERKFGFNIAFGLSLTVLKIALENGGRAYGCGMYFSTYAKDLLGGEALKSIQELKKKADPSSIMNPGKTVEAMSIAKMIRMALPMESMISMLANRFPGNPPGEILNEVKELPGDVNWFSYSCAQCGYCVDDCTQYYGRGWESQSPRGKWRLLKMIQDGDAKMTQQNINTFIACTTCEVCNEKCQLELPIEPSWFKLRGQLIQEQDNHTLPAFHIMEASAKKEWNIWAHYSKDRDQWVPEDLRPKIKEKAEIAFFPGCTASFVEKDIAEATARLLDKAGVEYTYLGQEEACCGIPMLMAGRWDTFEEIMDHNIAGMKKRGVKTIITSCPACRLVWNDFYRRFTEDRGESYSFVAKHYSEIVAEKIAEGSFKIDNPMSGTITYHDPCHMGRAAGVYEEPRALLQAIPEIDFVDMKYSRETAHCCGSVMSLVADPDAAAVAGKVRIDDAVDVGADTIITACPCCRVQLQATADYYQVDQIKVKDLATFVADACGYDIPDSQADISSSWAIFDAMIRMLTPSGMAAMMAEMLDELIEAMPGPMAGTMKWMKKRSPAVKAPMIAMMKPIMPKMFPILLPGMLPKVMPKMLEMVGEKIPMPDFMQEQMPDLMPTSMAYLMPKMLPDIIPHFMPYMVEYLNQ